MILAIMSAIGFGLLTALIYCGISKKREKASHSPHTYKYWGSTTLFSLMYIASYCILSILKRRPSIIYFFDNPKALLKTYALSALLMMIFATLAYAIAVLRKNACELNYCKSIGAIRFFFSHNGKEKLYPLIPAVSIKYTAYILIVFTIAIPILEYAQPDYTAWEAEVADRIGMHNQILRHMYTYRVTPDLQVDYFSEEPAYPLWCRADADVEVTGTKKNILVIGDSFTHIYGHTDANVLWWKQLDKVLKQRGYHDVNVYAVGQCGASTYDYMRWLRDTPMLEDLNPDIVIIGYVTNDPDLYNDKFILKTFYSPDVFDRPYSLRIFKRFFPDLAYKLNNMFQGKKQFNDVTGYPSDLKELLLIRGQRLIDYDNYAIRPLGEVISEVDVPAFLVTLPHMVDFDYFQQRYQPVLPLFEKAGVPVYNMLPDFLSKNFEAVDMENIQINLADYHPGPASTYFYANYVADILARDYPSVLGEQAKEVPDYNIHVNYALPMSLGPTSMNESPTRAVYEINYPDANAVNSFLYLPVQRDYVKLCFQYPVDLKSVRVEGDFLEECTLYITRIDPDRGYDTQEMFLAGTQTGSGAFWDLNGGNDVTALCLGAKISDNQSARLIITAEALEGGAQP